MLTPTMRVIHREEVFMLISRDGPIAGFKVGGVMVVVVVLVA